MTKHSDPKANENGRLPGVPSGAGWYWIRVDVSSWRQVAVGISRLGWFCHEELDPHIERLLGEHCAPKVAKMAAECAEWGRSSSRRSAEDRRF